MYNFFIFFCFVCFCIVLAAIAAFTFDVAMLRVSSGPIYGCGVVGDPLFYVQCDDEPWRWARETALNLPFFLWQAPQITLWGPDETRSEMAAVDLSLRRRALLRLHPRRADDRLYVASPAGTGQRGGESS